MQGAERTWDDLWCKIRPAVMTIFYYFYMIITIITLLVFVTVLNMLCAVSYRLIRGCITLNTCLINNFTVIHSKLWHLEASKCDFCHFRVPKMGTTFTKTHRITKLSEVDNFFW